MSELLNPAPMPELSEDQSLPGDRLRKARLEKGLSEEDVARRLNISSRYVKAIEASDIQALPNLAFARGYYRAYARYVEVPADEVIGQFNLHFGGNDTQRQVTSITKVRRQVKLGDPMIRWSVWLFAGLVIGASVWWWQTQNSPVRIEGTGATPASADLAEGTENEGLQPGATKTFSLDAATEEDADELISESGAAPAEGAEGDEEPQYLSAEEVARLQAQLDAKSLEESEPADTPSEDTETTTDNTAQQKTLAAVAAENGAQASLGHLLIRFSDACWLSVTDGSGKVLFADTKKAGEVLELSAQRPLKLRIGRASAISALTFDGEAQDLGEISGRDVKRLTLN